MIRSARILVTNRIAPDLTDGRTRSALRWPQPDPHRPVRSERRGPWQAFRSRSPRAGQARHRPERRIRGQFDKCLCVRNRQWSHHIDVKPCFSWSVRRHPRRLRICLRCSSPCFGSIRPKRSTRPDDPSSVDPPNVPHQPTGSANARDQPAACGRKASLVLNTRSAFAGIPWNLQLISGICLAFPHSLQFVEKKRVVENLNVCI